MAKTVIDTSKALGAIVARGVQKIREGFDDIERAGAAAALVYSAGGTLDADFGAALFGGAAGTHADYRAAIDTLVPACAAFKANPANAQALADLDQGDIY